MRARIRLVGANAQSELGDLATWLSREDEFRGQVSAEQLSPHPDDMGGVVEALAVTLSVPGLGAALAASLTVWIRHRRPSADIEIVRKGRSVNIVVRDIPPDDLAALLRQALED